MIWWISLVLASPCEPNQRAQADAAVEDLHLAVVLMDDDDLMESATRLRHALECMDTVVSREDVLRYLAWYGLALWVQRDETASVVLTGAHMRVDGAWACGKRASTHESSLMWFEAPWGALYGAGSALGILWREPAKIPDLVIEPQSRRSLRAGEVRYLNGAPAPFGLVSQHAVIYEQTVQEGRVISSRLRFGEDP